MTIEDKVGELRLRRQGDVCLTKLFRSNGVKGKALQEMSRCRLRLQASALSDITNGDGRHMSRAASKGEQDEQCPTCHRWPNQGRPGEGSWMRWKKSLSAALRGGQGKLRLLMPLGKWIDLEEKGWQWLCSVCEERLCQKGSKGWACCLQALGRRQNRSRNFARAGEASAEEAPQ